MRVPASTRVRGGLAAAALGCALACLSASTALADPAAQQSIVGGEAASIADLPSLAFIQAEDPGGGGFDCTGTVIAPRVILTAAHCAENIEGSGGFTAASEYLVATGADDLRKVTRKEALRVESTHVFPEFDPGNLHGDAAILVLASPTTATPVPLATSADAALYEGGVPVRLAGWGLTGGKATSAPKRLRTATTVVQDPATCKRRTKSFNPAYSPSFQLCTQNPPDFKTGGCFGDSGGPVIAQRADGSPVEIGVVSTGAPLCSTKLPNIFTRVDRLSTWAAAWVAATEAGGPPPSLPHALIPSMTKQTGEGFVGSLLLTTLGKEFLLAQQLRGRCQRQSSSAVKCGLSWAAGPNLYGALVTVFYASRGNAVAWDSHYRIKRVNRRCYLRSAHRNRCAVHTLHR
jgi:trypsin